MLFILTPILLSAKNLNRGKVPLAGNPAFRQEWLKQHKGMKGKSKRPEGLMPTEKIDMPTKTIYICIDCANVWTVIGDTKPLRCPKCKAILKNQKLKGGIPAFIFDKPRIEDYIYISPLH